MEDETLEQERVTTCGVQNLGKGWTEISRSAFPPENEARTSLRNPGIKRRSQIAYEFLFL